MEIVLLVIFVVIILLVATAMLVAFYYLRKGYRFIKRMTNGEMTMEEFERLSKKHYRSKNADGPQFDADYFKTADTNSQQTQQNYSRTVHTADGITITDQRNTHREKKIFAQDEGEYVDYKEVKD